MRGFAMMEGLPMVGGLLLLDFFLTKATRVVLRRLRLTARRCTSSKLRLRVKAALVLGS